jgi:hypothetical protein
VDLAAVFLLALLGGYYFAITWRFTAFSTKKADGHHLYFRAALYGVILFALALTLRIYLVGKYPSYADFDSQLSDYVRPVLKEEAGVQAVDEIKRAQWVVTAAYSLILGPLLALFLNLVTRRRWALRRSVEGLDKLLLEAQEQALPVSFTLNSGKIYIGVVVDTPNPASEAQATTILPMFSGYRGPTGRMYLTTDYQKLYESLRGGNATALGLSREWISQFKLTFTANTISTASLFSPAVYAEFNPDWKQQIEEPDKHEPQELVVTLKGEKKPYSPRRTALHLN